MRTIWTRWRPRKGERGRPGSTALSIWEDHGRGWIHLLLASVLEAGFTTTLRLSENFRNLPATGDFLVCVALSLVFLKSANRSIPLVRLMWTGAGAIGTVVIGTIWFDEPAIGVRILLILGIVACATGLKVSGGH